MIHPRNHSHEDKAQHTLAECLVIVKKKKRDMVGKVPLFQQGRIAREGGGGTRYAAHDPCQQMHQASTGVDRSGSSCG